MNREKVLATAKNLYADGADDNIEIDQFAVDACDDNPLPAEGGYWVRAWVWVSDADLEGEK